LGVQLLQGSSQNLSQALERSPLRVRLEEVSWRGWATWPSKGRIDLSRRKSVPRRGRLSWRKLKAQLEQIQLGPAVVALLSLLVNNRGQLEITHWEQAMRRRDLKSLATGPSATFRWLRASWRCPS
jgi:hypothetical protein